MRTKDYSKYLIISYVAVLILFLILTLGAVGEFNGFGMLINVIMLVIVLVIFLGAIKKFKTIHQVTKDLVYATSQIENYTWDDLKNNQIGILENSVLTDSYYDFMSDAKDVSENNTKCGVSISEYINNDILDGMVKKNVMNLIPGIMTGLGILGTFIGLSFGLQYFSTGSAEEITESIPPLMSGIKVAFHTSIYGMIFSLVFNSVFEHVMEEAYSAMDNFLISFEKYIGGGNEGSYIVGLHNMVYELPGAISAALQPQFEKMIGALEDFTKNMSQTQVEGVGELVDKFVEEMNESLGDNFKQLGEIIGQTCELQKENSDYMRDILHKVGEMTLDIQEINELSGRTIESFSQYVDDVEKLQAIINENHTVVNLQMEANKQQEEKLMGYIDTLVAYEKEIKETSARFSHDMAQQVELLKNMETEISEGTMKSMEALSKKAEECSVSVSEVAKKQIEAILTLSNSTTGDMDRAAQELSKVSQQLNNQLQTSLTSTFDIFDKNLAEISQRLSGTISEVEATTGRVPTVVADSYDAMQKSYEEFQGKLEALIHGLDIMQRNMPKIYSDLMKSN